MFCTGVILYRGCVIVAETVSSLTFHGSRDTAVDGKVMFAHFVLMVFYLQIDIRLFEVSVIVYICQ